MKTAKNLFQYFRFDRFKRSTPEFTASPLIEFTNNGGRPEIAVETPSQRKRFLSFVQHATRTLDEDIRKKTHEVTRQMTGDDLRGFSRYFYEGWLRFKQSNLASYQAEGLNADMLKKLIPVSSFQGLAGVDFGFGNGEVARILSGLGAKMRGYDLGPFFVQNARKYGLHTFMASIDQDVRQFEEEFGISKNSQDFVIATLVLDRLQKPIHFIRNFFEALRPKGHFALQTLLPIIPQDDGPVKKPIIYTQPHDQLTPGKTTEEDRKVLIGILKDCGADHIDVLEVPYTVKSLDGVQNYKLWSFRGKKAFR